MSLTHGDTESAVVDGALKLTLEDEMQDGDSLEPGELVTPPHQTSSCDGSPTPTIKLTLPKDTSKALRKLIQINKDSFGTDKTNDLHKQEVQQADQPVHMQSPIENGTPAAASASPEESADNDESEGLYSDTDSSTDIEQANVEDVQQARKEKEAEAAAAMKPQPPVPAPHPFLSISPLRFHMRPPCYEFPRMGFKPRMPRGGMRGIRPSFFSKAPGPPLPAVGNKPATATTPTSLQTSQKTQAASSTYGPALPPAPTKSLNSSGTQPAATTGRTKRPQTDVMWTQRQPSLSYTFNILLDCKNSPHKGCKLKTVDLPIAKKSTQSKETRNDSRREDDPKDKPSKSNRQSKSKSSKSEHHNNKPKEIKGKTPPPTNTAIVKEQPKTPPIVEAAKDSHKIFDIFAESPPRLTTDSTISTTPKKPPPVIVNSTKVSLIMNKGKCERPPEATPGTNNQMERSTTPPIPNLFSAISKLSEAKSTPLLKASEIHSRIDALLQDNDLHLDALLATKEKLLRKTNEHKGKSAQQKDIRKVCTAAETEVPLKRRQNDDSKKQNIPDKTSVRIKQEPTESNTSSSRQSNETTHSNKHAETTAEPSLLCSNPFKRIAVLNELPKQRRLSPKSFERWNEHEARDAQRTDRSGPSRTASREPQRSVGPTHPLHGNRSISRDVSRERHSSTKNSSDMRKDKRLSDRHDRSCSRSREHERERERGNRNDARTRHSYESQNKKIRNDDFEEHIVKVERNKSRTPPRRPRTPEVQHRMLHAREIKVERDATPPLSDVSSAKANEATCGTVHYNGSLLGKRKINKHEQSPDTDDYIDNWENDDSMAGGSTPKLPLNNIVDRMNGRADIYDADASNYMNKLCDTRSTPPPKTRIKTEVPEDNFVLPTPNSGGNDSNGKALINIQELYDKFMKTIKMSNADGAIVTAADETECLSIEKTCNQDDQVQGSNSEGSKNSSLTNSTAEDDSSSTESTSSSSSSDDDDDDDDDEDEDNDDDSSSDEEASSDDEQNKIAVPSKNKHRLSPTNATAVADTSIKESVPKESHKKNSVSKDLRKLKSLDDNLSRIQMMRENYDSGDDICEELVKMESLFLTQKNAIMEKYRKQDLKLSEQKKPEVEQRQQQPPPVDEATTPERPPLSPVNKIFDANREAIKLTISPLKLSRKPAIFDKDEADVVTPSKQQQSDIEEKDFTEKLAKPAKEIAIVKPTIMETKSRRVSSPIRRRTRERSNSRARSHSHARSHSRAHIRRSSPIRRRPSRSKGESRSASPRRWRPPSPRFGARPSRFNKRARSRSNTFSRSRSRSRSPHRRRRLKFVGNRRRSSLSPLRPKSSGPRSPPPPHRRRSYSRSPLPFKPPSPPMRRSWSSSASRSPRRRHPRSISPRSRSPSPRERLRYADYFEDSHNLEAAAAYYYNMLHCGEEPSAENYEYAAYAAAYMDTAYNMSDAYAQYIEYSSATDPENATSAFYNQELGATMPNEMGTEPPVLPKAAPVAVQKGNVLEIVPSLEPSATVMGPDQLPVCVEDAPKVETPAPEEEDESKPKRKRVNFVDKVLPNNESEDEDEKVVEQAVQRILKRDQERVSARAKLFARTREELLAIPPPLPPACPKPAHLEKAICTRKKSKFRYYHFDPFKGVILRTSMRLLRPPCFDAKYVAMLMKSGRLPLPRFALHALRHGAPLPRHPLTKANASVGAAMLKENFVRIPTHPPPPMGQGLTPAPRPPFFANFLRLRPPLFVHGNMPSSPSQPIPVLGQSYPGPRPVHMPIPPMTPTGTMVTSSGTSSNPLSNSAYLGPQAVPVPEHFTPPPLPALPMRFTINTIPTIKEIMPVDILQKIGPLPKTLDLDSAPGMDETNTDLNEFGVVSTEANEVDASNAPPPDGICQKQLVEIQ